MDYKHMKKLLYAAAERLSQDGQTLRADSVQALVESLGETAPRQEQRRPCHS